MQDVAGCEFLFFCIFALLCELLWCTLYNIWSLGVFAFLFMCMPLKSHMPINMTAVTL